MKKFAQTLMAGAGAHKLLEERPHAEVVPLPLGTSLQGDTPSPLALSIVEEVEEGRMSIVPSELVALPPSSAPLDAIPPRRGLRRSFAKATALISGIMLKPTQEDMDSESLLSQNEPRLSRFALWRRRFTMDRQRRGLLWAIRYAFREFSTGRRS